MASVVVMTERIEIHQFIQQCYFCDLPTYDCHIINERSVHFCKECISKLQRLFLMNSEECCTYEGQLQKRIECLNLHPNQTKTKGYGFECLKCQYVVVLPEDGK